MFCFSRKNLVLMYKYFSDSESREKLGGGPHESFWNASTSFGSVKPFLFIRFLYIFGGFPRDTVGSLPDSCRGRKTEIHFDRVLSVIVFMLVCSA
nr:hypothetical protein CFP56_69013 [Quercus suber]